MTDTANVDDFLAHHGVLGMKWGHHKAQTSGGSGGSSAPAKKSRAELRALDKASVKNDKAARNAEIDAARQRYDTSARSNYLKAKAQYKVDRHQIGKREALKAFNKVKDQNMADYEKASELKSGKETVVAVLATIGVTAASVALQAAIKR